MTQSEYVMSGCENFHSEFLFSNNAIISGVITTFFPHKQDAYQLVRSNNIIEFKKCMDEKDYENMQKLCEVVDISEIVTVKRIY